MILFLCFYGIGSLPRPVTEQAALADPASAAQLKVSPTKKQTIEI